MSVLGKRLKEARLRAGLSQEQLGIDAGLDPMSASARMNRYELGNRVPNFELVQELAKVLKVPAPYFYADDEAMAKLILAAHAMSAKELAKLVDAIQAQPDL